MLYATAGEGTRRSNRDQAGFARSDGLSIHFEHRGEGPAIVLMHGWSASTRTNWEAPGWIERLRPLRRVVGVDVRGHGASDKPHEQSRYGYAAMAHDVLAVMDHLEIERADFVGHSLGAFSGVHLLGHHSDRFGAFVLMGIGDETPESLAVLPVITEALRAASPEAIEDPIGRAYRGIVDGDPRNDREALALAALQMWPEGFPLELGGPGLGRTDNPVLVLNGSDDRPYVESDERLVAAIPGARLSRIPGADHLGPVLDPRFQDAAAVFLAEAAPR